MSNQLVSPKFIRRPTAEALQREMQRMILSGLKYNFRSIQFVNGNWYAWYDDYIQEPIRAIR